MKRRARTSVAEARSIMGACSVSVSEAQDVLRVTRKTMSPFLTELKSGVPFSAVMLSSCRQDYALVPGLPLSLRALRVALERRFGNVWAVAPGEGGGGDLQHWYMGQRFAEKSQVTPSWYVIRMSPEPGSLNRNFAEQAAKLPPNAAVPRACEAAYLAILFAILGKGELLHDVEVRCSDFTDDGLRVTISAYGYAFHRPDDLRDPKVGIVPCYCS